MDKVRFRYQFCIGSDIEKILNGKAGRLEDLDYYNLVFTHARAGGIEFIFELKEKYRSEPEEATS